MNSGSSLLARLGRRRLARDLSLTRNIARKENLRLYLVGGCVRDLVLDIPLNDLDLVVEGKPLGLCRQTAAKLGAAASSKTKFETCSLSRGTNLKIDFAMSRTESYRSPAALPRVSAAPIEADLFRRDFTANAMAIGLTGPHEGHLLDPLNGLVDIKRKVLRTHHPESLLDDPTRSFRAARFASRLGFSLHRRWARDLDDATARGAFRQLSGTRIRNELNLVIREINHAGSFSLVSRWRLMQRIFPRFKWDPKMRSALKKVAAMPEPVVEGMDLLWIILARGVAVTRREQMCRRMQLTGRRAGRISAGSTAPERAAALGGTLSAAGYPSPNRLEILSRFTKTEMAMLGLFGDARTTSSTIRFQEKWELAQPLLDGHALIRLGVPVGPMIRDVLHKLRVARLRGLVADRKEETRFVSRLMGRRTRNPLDPS
jgi:tRNA nucleotidyltransferase (CCA-adding enzyme)